MLKQVGRDVFHAGELCLLVDRRGRKHLLQLEPGQKFHSHTGVISHDELIGSRVGTRHVTSHGAAFFAIRPRPMDFVLEMPRLAQVVYPKDFGAILWRVGVRPGFEVLEVGLGSGSLAIALLLAVGEQGKVTSLDLRWDHVTRATQNVRRLLGDLAGRHRVVIGDAAVCLRGTERFDAAVVDIPSPWSVLETVASLLRSGGFVACFSPSTTQVAQTAVALDDLGFEMRETVEILERGWYVKGRAVRPDHRMVAHTGFVTVACKVAGGVRAP